MSKSTGWQRVHQWKNTLVLIALVGGFLFYAQSSRGIGAPNSQRARAILDRALVYYEEQRPTPRADAENRPLTAEARVQDFGCHSEIHIWEEGAVRMRLVYWNGGFYEL